MPLMVFMGESKETRRSKEAVIRRAANAGRRGWTWERRQSTKVKSESPDGGEHHGSKKEKGCTHMVTGSHPMAKGKGGKRGRPRWREVESSLVEKTTYGPPAVAGNRARGIGDSWLKQL